MSATLLLLLSCADKGADSGAPGADSGTPAIGDSSPGDSAPGDSSPTDSAPTDSAPTDSAPTDSAPTDADGDGAGLPDDPVGLVLGRHRDLVHGDQPGVLALALADDPVGLTLPGIEDAVPLLQERGGLAQLAGELGAQLVEHADHLASVEHAVARHGHRASALHHGDDLVDAVERIHRRLTPVMHTPTQRGAITLLRNWPQLMMRPTRRAGRTGWPVSPAGAG
jgi:hypothetical protein